MNQRRNSTLRITTDIAPPRSAGAMPLIERAALVCVLCVAGCIGDGSDHGSDVGDGYGAGDDVAASSNALRLRWRRARSSWRSGAATSDTSAGTGTAGSSTGTGTGEAGTSAQGSADSAGSQGSDGEAQPAASSSGSTTQFNGARCPNNQAVGGSCGHYGDQCTYDTSSGTHYCTCLAFAAENNGTQGWSCR